MTQDDAPPQTPTTKVAPETFKNRYTGRAGRERSAAGALAIMLVSGIITVTVANNSYNELDPSSNVPPFVLGLVMIFVGFFGTLIAILDAEKKAGSNGIAYYLDPFVLQYGLSPLPKTVYAVETRLPYRRPDGTLAYVQLVKDEANKSWRVQVCPPLTELPTLTEPT